MKTIEISNDKARVLGDFLAQRWAKVATWLAASKVVANNPVRSNSLRETEARIARHKRELAAIGATLEQLGVDLPKVDREAFVRPYKSPRPGAKTVPMYVSHYAVKEQQRLAGAITEQLA